MRMAHVLGQMQPVSSGNLQLRQLPLLHEALYVRHTKQQAYLLKFNCDGIALLTCVLLTNSHRRT